jgi:membrane fusion protein (multidrug efflux system)
MKGYLSLMRFVLYGFLGLAVILVGSGCDRDADGTVDATRAEPPRRTASLVEATRPLRRDVSAYLEETGHIMAENQVEVLAKGTGHCLSVLVEEGDKVQEGQVLAELDKAEMEAQIRQSRVNLQQHKTTFDRAEWGLKEGITAPVDRDNAKSAYEQAKATLDMQEVQLAFLSIRAPISGVVTKRLIQQGMLVSTGMPVFTIVDPASFILPINVTERSIPRLRVGQEARVTIDSAGKREFNAHVRRINPGVDAQSGTVKVILDFDSADHEFLRESAFARYSLVMETHENALVVPKDAIVEENAQRYVMIVQKASPPAPGEAGTAAGQEAAAPSEQDAGSESDAESWVAKRVEVETGLEDTDHTEIRSGISEDDLVITLGQQTVRDGDTVEVGNLEDTLESRDALTADQLLEKARKEREERDKATAAAGAAPGSG